ncbi:MAG: hypothetical protein ACRETI_00915 [Steroidobacteraceae bacterium]
MNWKIVFIGGVIYYLVLFLLSMVGGNLIHGPEGVLGPIYREYAAFWRPELNADPPDMVALMKMWVPIGLLSSFLLAGIYSVIRSSLTGSGLVRGVKFGVIGWIFALVAALGYWGVFNLPNTIWTWWLAEGIWMHLIAGALLGWVAQKIAPANA